MTPGGPNHSGRSVRTMRHSAGFEIHHRKEEREMATQNQTQLPSWIPLNRPAPQIRPETVTISRNAISALVIIAIGLAGLFGLFLGYAVGNSDDTHTAPNSAVNSGMRIPSKANMDSLAKVSAQSNVPCWLSWDATQYTYQIVCAPTK